MTHLINGLFISISSLAHGYLFPIMVLGFVFGLFVKFLVHLLIKAQLNLVTEFEKRVHRHIDHEYEETLNLESYDEILSSLWTKTQYEIYTLRSKNLRRKLDSVIGLTERLFLIEEGAKRLAKDTQKEARYYKYEQNPNFEGTAHFALSINPYFQTFFSLVPLKFVNNIINILPGLFIIGGIFGTFLGITGGIPQLKNMDPGNIDLAKSTLGFFLDNMAYSMNASVVGIFFSVCFTVINAAFSAKALHAECVHKLLHSMELLWRDTKAKSHESYDHVDQVNMPPPIPFKKIG